MAGYIPPGADKKKIIRDNRLHLWDNPYLYQVCADGLLRRCIATFETRKILEHCHSSPYGVTMKLSAPMLRCGKVVSSGPSCMMMSSHSTLQPMSEAQKYQYKGRNATDFESPD
jgi:hypothetical protein